MPQNFSWKTDYPGRKKEKYINPFFPRKKKSFLPILHWPEKNRAIIIFFIIMALLAWPAYVLLFSSFFRILDLEIIIAEEPENLPLELRLPTEKIREAARLNLSERRFLGLWRNDNIFFYNKKSVLGVLIRDFPITDVNFERVNRHFLRLIVQPKEYSFIWREDGQDHYLSPAGEILGPADGLCASSSQNFYLIENQGQLKIIDGYAPQSARLDQAVQIARFFSKQIPEVKLEKFIFNDTDGTLRALVQSGPELIFSPEAKLQSDLAAQLSKTLIFIKEKAMDKFRLYKYIDARWGDRIYGE
ncbi:hypothetical protein COX69_03420 [Candidatus Falkowbacteria bacterium CG_4_10_14_0_2_um_filter_48_10]|uniref:POTRA domain-containing protein n=1 Tax=Candidatus Falkowbacteria bacterium CG23_combo_of_CG06-09_8_20_14_all_49_15 TaxID=1974572 RepID=A0A2G9ZM52_9BACT|nr:MAG: hypothetical protein COX22_03240 [Candidatus Falkowbacteria bacterium CG23_combo_of_CG06-09_8_20_14_all_49_15]PJA07965.1 MAG: hypothetical protein COX69_03420 [Candidatus Falkowbacteria bacterium CG_4_10_14_0_2_um_filter_48_10]